jgi:hypothetical protein
VPFSNTTGFDSHGNALPLEAFVCRCDSGWVSFGDLCWRPGRECDISTAYVEVAARATIALALFALLSSVWQAQLWMRSHPALSLKQRLQRELLGACCHTRVIFSYPHQAFPCAV